MVAECTCVSRYVKANKSYLTTAPPEVGYHDPKSGVTITPRAYMVLDHSKLVNTESAEPTPVESVETEMQSALNEDLDQDEIEQMENWQIIHEIKSHPFNQIDEPPLIEFGTKDGRFFSTLLEK